MDDNHYPNGAPEDPILQPQQPGTPGNRDNHPIKILSKPYDLSEFKPPAMAPLYFWGRGFCECGKFYEMFAPQTLLVVECFECRSPVEINLDRPEEDMNQEWFHGMMSSLGWENY